MAPRRKSHIWFHFNESTDNLTAKCNHCSLSLSIKNGSLGNLNRHMKNRHPLININIQRQSIQPTSEVSQASNTETSEATPAPGPSSSSSCAFSNENGRATTANTMPISNFLRKPPSARKQD